MGIRWSLRLKSEGIYYTFSVSTVQPTGAKNACCAIVRLRGGTKPRIMYVDKKFAHELWTDLYDVNMKLWKVFTIEASSKVINGVGTSILTTLAGQMWDVQNDHSTIFFTAAGPGRDVMVNDEVPRQYLDIPRYSTPGGLMQIVQ